MQTHTHKRTEVDKMHSTQDKAPTRTTTAFGDIWKSHISEIFMNDVLFGLQQEKSEGKDNGV